MDNRFKKPIPASEIKDRREAEEVKTDNPSELTSNLVANLKLLRTLLGDSSDLVIRRFRLPSQPDLELACLFIDGLTNTDVIDRDIMQSLMHLSRIENFADNINPSSALEMIEAHLLTVGEIKVATKLQEILHAILSGDTILLIKDSPKAILVNSRGFPSRGVQEPNTEAVVRGPRDGFSESLRINTALIRRRIKDPDLVVESVTIGKRTATDIAIIYIKDLANPKVVQEVKGRLSKVRIDAILESGYIEQLVQDRTMSPFPQMQATERPDKVAAGILEGRVAVVVDGTPFVLILPVVWAQLFQSPEDYYERTQLSTFIRLIRLLANTFSLFLPGIYIALTSFHPEMLPTSLAMALAAARAGVPFSILSETLIMEIAVEIVREASIRLPGPIGPTIGIVGGLILGEASVQAGIVSPLTVIVVAITAIGSLSTPNYSTALSVRLVRFLFIFLGASFGLIGITTGAILLIVHLAGLESWGVPYLAPYAPYQPVGQGDTILRRSFPYQRTRPPFLKPLDEHRMPEDVDQKETADETSES
ncbi:MAG: spore germination protein [bacterium]|jgi:hypothetical protein